MNDTVIPDPVCEMPKMGLPKPKPRFTVDEYLEMERKAEERQICLDEWRRAKCERNLLSA
jgi:hypothetical protein